MSAYAARAPRTATVYVCPVTCHPLGTDAYTYVSGPMVDTVIRPLATGVIRRRGDGCWTVQTTSLLVNRKVTVADEATAKRRMVEWLTRVAGEAFQRFSPIQRYAMGQQCCPYPVPSGTCDLPPEVGTVWCKWHPKGKVT